MAKFSISQSKEHDSSVLELDEGFVFDEEEDEFMERSQRKLIQAKRERPPRMRDY